MKPLKLSKKQQVKLLKLIKQFFPEVDVSDDECSTYIGDYGIVELVWEKSRSKNCISYEHVPIHWYELCMNELPRRMFSYVDNYLRNDRTGQRWDWLTYWGFKEPSWTDIPRFIIEGENHPVEALFEFYKTGKDKKLFK